MCINMTVPFALGTPRGLDRFTIETSATKVRLPFAYIIVVSQHVSGRVRFIHDSQSLAEVSLAEVSLAEVSLAEVSLEEVSLAEVSLAEVSLAEVYPQTFIFVIPHTFY